jgi:hypothetical protein
LWPNYFQGGIIYGITHQEAAMPKSPTSLPAGVRATDILSIIQFATVFPIDAVNEVLEKHDCGTIRVRHLPNELVIYFVMMLALFRDCSHREVFRCVASALNGLVGKPSNNPFIPSGAALSKARDRVKDKPLEELFHRFAKPVAASGSAGCFFKKRWRTVAVDGCLIDVENTPKNRQYFGSSTNQNKTQARSPQVRFVGLMELGTHVFFSAAIGGYHDGEISLVKGLIQDIQSDMICLADRNFYSFDLFKQVNDRGAALLFRVQRGLSFVPERQLPDGSYLLTLYSATDTKRMHGVPARFFQYKVKGAKDKETFYMITNILDPKQATAEELSALYCERWEYEGALDELKTHLNAKFVILRSKTPALVIQELWGLLMTHYVIRRTMYQAASSRQLDPDRLSFIHTVRVIRRTLGMPNSFPPEDIAPENAQ